MDLSNLLGELIDDDYLEKPLPAVEVPEGYLTHKKMTAIHEGIDQLACRQKESVEKCVRMIVDSYYEIIGEFTQGQFEDHLYRSHNDPSYVKPMMVMLCPAMLVGLDSVKIDPDLRFMLEQFEPYITWTISFDIEDEKGEKICCLCFKVTKLDEESEGEES
jgi:hypothetical protein